MSGGWVRRCPQCGSERPVAEIYCENPLHGSVCGWPLADEPLVAAGSASPSAPAVAQAAIPSGPRCANGHPMGPGDQLCLICGADPAPAAAAPAAPDPAATAIDGWLLLRREQESEAAERFAARAAAGGDEVELTLYRAGAEPDRAVQEVRRRMPDDHVPRFLASGRWEERAYEVTEKVAGGSLAELLEAQRASAGESDGKAGPRAHGAGRSDGHPGESRGPSPAGIPMDPGLRRDDDRDWRNAGPRADGAEHSERTAEEPGAMGDEVRRSQALLRRVVDELSRALGSFAELSLRHRDLHPGNVLIRTREPLDLVITGFGSARLSDFDLEAVAPLELTRYSAPEAIVGAVSAASDWWSLGMIALELATAGACFAGAGDQAFRLHVVTRGVRLPAELDPEIRLLLRGLLTRDPLRRWAAPEVRAWLAGEPVEPPPADDGAAGAARGESGPESGKLLRLAGRAYGRPELFALAAAEAETWDEARDLTLRGAVATWLAERGSPPEMVAHARRLLAAEALPEDFRHALTLQAMNGDLPLILRGEIVTPGWLLDHPREGCEMVTGELSRQLERMGREEWLVRLRTRAAQVRERARLLEIALDDERLRVALVATSRARLEAEREALRRIYPDTGHAGLASLLEKSRLPDEDLIVLVAAEARQFLSLENLLGAARDLAARVAAPWDDGAAAELLVLPRRAIFAAVDQRTAKFARCGHFEIDGWAEAFRVERRMPLPRAAVLLAFPAESWREPPKQQYVANLLEHFEKRVAGTVSRGPLARFTLGKTTPRIDLAELGTGLRPAEALLNHVLSRAEVPVTLDPAAYRNENLEGRLRRLASQATAFRRDTGLDGRILGFPFLLLREAKGTEGRPARTRLLPVLLWPVVFEMPPGAAANAVLMFDREREEVRLNPALEGLLGSAAMQRWREAREELLGRSTLKAGEALDVFAGLAAPRGRTLARLPGREVELAPGSCELVPGAALFNAEFTGQSVAEDLRKMRQALPAGTGLEAVLRAAAEAPALPPVPPVAEQDRYLVVESDPSQEDAVMRSRLSPGLLVEGPPGTGKSQTIVNVIADAVGRGQTVLVVCQKQAALTVVKKRLEAEGLGERLFLVVDANRDRERVVGALREQLDDLRRSPPDEIGPLRRQRAEKAARIEVAEADLDRHHQALHHDDPVAEASYRQLLGELVALEAAGGHCDAPGLRPLFRQVGRGPLTRLEETVAPLAGLWLAAAYEDSPLAALRPFEVDGAGIAALTRELQSLIEAEAGRRETLIAHPVPFEVDDPAPLAGWLSAWSGQFEGLSAAEWSRLAEWHALFGPEPGRSLGDEALAALEKIAAALEALPAGHHDAALFAPLGALAPVELQRQLADAGAAVAPVSLLGRLDPRRWWLRRRVRGRLEALGEPATEERLAQLQRALELEARLRPLRAAFAEVRERLGLAAPATLPTLQALRREAGRQLADLRAVATAVAGLAACPRPEEAAALARSATTEAFAELRRRFQAAIARQAARTRSRAALAPLAAHFAEPWLAAVEERIARNADACEGIARVVGALDTLEPYQLFRARAARLDADALAIFALLRPRAEALHAIPAPGLEEAVRHTLRREALLAWKGRIETEFPELLFERPEIERRVAALGDLDRELRRLNQRLLAADVGAGQLGTAAEWEQITRLRGQRRKTLREFVAQGKALGLLRLRPIWLMNPDVASRLLPLEPGFFDLVVYDEASQMPVEYAVPTLFRARRVFISGDEKQMPPTRFFAAALDEEEEEAEGGELLDDSVTEAERIALEESWNRREVKDCPDLLQLGRGTLPPATLQIHYRSQYRELIGFSNAAFYRGELSVPVRHPPAEVRRMQPIKVVRVDGIYEEQTNPAEAEKVVELVAALWAQPDEPPSLGVVTFNRKQADLVETLIEQRAFADPEFLRAYQRERERNQDGEDMGFFVKNVENVQGDERDVILFSTTFGRDRRGGFRRSFGVLGQAGGERRLNVAVTRARRQVVLVTSMPVSDVSDWLNGERAPSGPRDFLQAYLDYAERLSHGNLTSAEATARRLGRAAAGRRHRGQEVDGFLAVVGEFLKSRGWNWVRADEGDAFGIDFAIEDPRTGLFGIGIECDAPRQRLLERARAREIWRPQVLRRAIPVVHRVSSRNWYHRPHEERSRLEAAIRTALGEGTGGAP